MYRLLIALALAVLVGPGYVATPAPAYAAVPNPNEVYLESISYGGTGCPQGSVGTSFSDDRTVFTLIFDQFVASAGPGVPATESRKACQLFIRLHVPPGFTYAVHTFNYRGYVQLPDGATAEQQSTYYFFPSDGPQRSAGTWFRGPVARDYLVTDVLANAAWWPFCGGSSPLVVDSQVRLNVPDSQPGQLTVSSLDGKARTILSLSYRPC